MSRKHKRRFLGIAFVAFGGAVVFMSDASGWLFGESKQIAGRVVDHRGGALEKARIRIVGEKEFVVSDAKGRFTLKLAKKRQNSNRRIALAAGKEGFFNGGKVVRSGRGDVPFQLQPVPRQDNTNYRFLIASPLHDRFRANEQVNCANCHTTHLWEWGTSKMGKTVLNQEVAKEYQSFKSARRANQDDSCADCHAPLAAVGNPGKTDLNQSIRQLGNRSKGIECDFCHKISDVEASNRPGVQSVEFTRRHFGGGMMQRIMAFGPYDDVTAMPMAASYHPLYKKSEYCSSCHQDGWETPDGRPWDYLSVYPDAKNRKLYEKGRVIPNQWTYQEWSEWQATLTDDHQDRGTTCQNCHMNWSKEMMPYYRYIVSGRIKDQFGNERNPDSIAPHRFQGATAKMLEGVARIAVEATAENERLTVQVGVTNVNAGHRLPTGESSRNLILLVEAKDGNGRALRQLSGPAVPHWGGIGNGRFDYARRPGKGFARVTADERGNKNVPTWKAVTIVSDNRLKPKVPDRSEYTFSLPGSVDSEEVTVTAKLIYRKKFTTDARTDRKTWKETAIEETSIGLDEGGL